MTTYMITGATGQLGRLVLDHLLKTVAPADVAVLVRSDEAKAEFDARGVSARIGDYSDPASLETALDGVDRFLLISGSEVGARVPQHRNVIKAAKARGVEFIAYTSILDAAHSPLMLAREHKATEEMLAESGIPHTLLRNGWYSENLGMAVGGALAMGQHFGAAKDGRFSYATRNDYAEAAAIVLTGGHDGAVLELGGDAAFTQTEVAALLTELSGTTVSYVDMPEEAYEDALVGAGLPEGLAAMLADSDAGAATGALFDDSRTLSGLIGRPTTPLADTIKAVLAAG
ncbi:SDR family oxidoreductase [Litorisediminicola beolgyonensis]|uniref:SDR family oxidoreductase n=1 Tax=Litorisediminicola beolgyonensis TaxID=1173614 RepID=A0ABW3ZMG8_9RHOB